MARKSKVKLNVSSCKGMRAKCKVRCSILHSCLTHTVHHRYHHRHISNISHDLITSLFHPICWAQYSWTPCFLLVFMISEDSRTVGVGVTDQIPGCVNKKTLQLWRSEGISPRLLLMFLQLILPCTCDNIIVCCLNVRFIYQITSSYLLVTVPVSEVLPEVWEWILEAG